jgi:hypothetical protein
VAIFIISPPPPADLSPDMSQYLVCFAVPLDPGGRSPQGSWAGFPEARLLRLVIGETIARLQAETLGSDRTPTRPQDEEEEGEGRVGASQHIDENKDTEGNRDTENNMIKEEKAYTEDNKSEKHKVKDDTEKNSAGKKLRTTTRKRHLVPAHGGLRADSGKTEEQQRTREAVGTTSTDSPASCPRLEAKGDQSEAQLPDGSGGGGVRRIGSSCRGENAHTADSWRSLGKELRQVADTLGGRRSGVGHITKWWTGYLASASLVPGWE